MAVVDIAVINTDVVDRPDLGPVDVDKDNNYLAGASLSGGSLTGCVVYLDPISRKLELTAGTSLIKANAYGILLNDPRPGQPCIVQRSGPITLAGAGAVIKGEPYFVSITGSGKIMTSGSIDNTTYVTGLGVGMDDTKSLMLDIDVTDELHA